MKSPGIVTALRGLSVVVLIVPIIACFAVAGLSDGSAGLSLSFFIGGFIFATWTWGFASAILTLQLILRKLNEVAEQARPSPQPPTDAAAANHSERASATVQGVLGLGSKPV